MNASRLEMYFHLPRMPLPASPFGTGSVGAVCLTIVHPDRDGLTGGVSVHTRPSPHHNAKSWRIGSKSRPQNEMSIELEASSVSNSPVGSTGVITMSLLEGPGVLR